MRSCFLLLKKKLFWHNTTERPPRLCPRLTLCFSCFGFFCLSLVASHTKLTPDCKEWAVRARWKPGAKALTSAPPHHLTPRHNHTQRGGARQGRARARPRVRFYLRALAYLHAGSASTWAVGVCVGDGGGWRWLFSGCGWELVGNDIRPGPSSRGHQTPTRASSPFSGVSSFFSLTEKVTGAFVIPRMNLSMPRTACDHHHPHSHSHFYPRQRVHVRALYGSPLAARGHFNGIVLPSASQTQVGKYHPGNK